MRTFHLSVQVQIRFSLILAFLFWVVIVLSCPVLPLRSYQNINHSCVCCASPEGKGERKNKLCVTEESHIPSRPSQ